MPLKANVTDSPYNAAGDGTTDDRSAFQDAIDDVNADGGGVVEVPPADVGYLIDATGLAARSNVELRLDKGARILKRYGDTGIAKALIHNADTTFATKVTGFSITGQGTLTADDGSAITATNRCRLMGRRGIQWITVPTRRIRGANHARSRRAGLTPPRRDGTV